MTETAILPGGAGTDVDTTMTPPVDVEEAGDSRRKLMIVGGAAGVVVLAAAGYFLLHGNGGSSAAPTFPVRHGIVATGAGAPSTGSAAGSSTATGKSPSTLPKRVKLHVRDPFKPLVVAPVTAGTSSGTTTVPAATNPGPAPSSPADTGAGTPSVAPSVPVVQPSTPPTTSTGGIPAGHPLWIQLLHTSGTKTAMFKVGYPHRKFHKFRVAAPVVSSNTGTVFGGEFDLIGIQNGQVTLQIGDASPFDLAPGLAHVIG